MTFAHYANRRTVMTALTALALSDAAAASTEGEGARTLVAYFSRTGNTRVVAGLIQRAQGADLFEMQSAHPYPEDYLATVAQAREERDRGYAPPLAAKVSRMADYGTVFIGFPIWGETAPPPIRSFLSAYELADKTFIPFVS